LDLKNFLTSCTPQPTKPTAGQKKVKKALKANKKNKAKKQSKSSLENSSSDINTTVEDSNNIIENVDEVNTITEETNGNDVTVVYPVDTKPGTNMVLPSAPPSFGLNALSKYYLDRPLDKDWRVRASDWETEQLTNRQVRTLIRIIIILSICSQYIFRDYKKEGLVAN